MMKKRWKRWEPGWLIGALLGLALAVPGWADVLLTQVTDTVRGADGTPAQGSVLISWPSFTTGGGQSVAKGSTSVTLTSGGVLSISLAPNVGSTPIGTYYTAVYHLAGGAVTREYWVVPASASPVTVASVRASVLPTAVAMQTVSKQYVDQAIARAIVAPNSDPSNPYVEKAGDTMTGPLILSGDPTTASQAVTKSYVDTADASLQAGLGQKVSMVPSGNQTVTQPANTRLEVNRLNGVIDVGQFKSATNLPDGVNNTLAQPDCAQGCDALIQRDYPSYDQASAAAPSTTHFVDKRGGMQLDYFVNPHNTREASQDAGAKVAVVSSETAVEQKARAGGQIPYNFGMWIDQRGLSGGNNLFPEQVTSSVPYFKSTYTALNVEGTYNTQGQHVLVAEKSHCYAVGDCLIGSKFLYGSGGYRDSADEGIHPYDFEVREDPAVFQGVCQSGCSTGSTQLTIAATKDAGTQGDGRFLINTTPSKVLSTGSIVGGDSNSYPFPKATFTGTSFPLSTMFEISAKVFPRADNMAPGTVIVAILTSGLPAGYSTNTLALSATSGVACVVDATPGYAFTPTNYEMANYQVVDGTHIQLTLNKPHDANATISVGGLCGYGVEQVSDTRSGKRQVFPIVGALDATTIQYAAGHTPILGQTAATGAYVNAQLSITSIARNAGVVTVNLASSPLADLTGLPLTVTGVADSSYNGTFAVTSTGARSYTYSQAGPNSTSIGGTFGILTGDFRMYPMAEVLSVMNPTSKQVDGTMTLAPNTVNWAANDTVEQPHYFLIRVAGDSLLVSQQMPRPTINHSTGVIYQDTLGPGSIGYQISNQVDATSYFGHGGSHAYPTTGLQVDGVWGTSMTLTAGEGNVFRVLCKTGGCARWNSGYTLISLQNATSTDTVGYDPVTSTMTFGMRGAAYRMSPYSLTADTINATTINATTINGLPAASGTASGVVMLPSVATTNVLSASASVDTTNASNITRGTLPAAVLPTALSASSVTAAGAGTNADLQLKPKGNGQVLVGTGGWAYATAASGAGSLLMNNGTTDSPNLKFAYGNSVNLSVDSAPFGALPGCSGQMLRFIKDADEATGAVIGCLDLNGNLVVLGNVVSGGSMASAVENMSFSPTPVFSLSKGNSRMVLTGNVTSSSIGAGADGQRKCFNLVQDSSGSRTFVWPANVKGGMVVGSAANVRSHQCFVYYAADNAWLAESGGLVQ